MLASSEGSAEGIVSRAAAILRGEIAAGALANVGQASRTWSQYRVPSLLGGGLGRSAGSLDTLLESFIESLIQASPVSRLPTVRPGGPVRPGETARLVASLVNDAARAVDVRFACGDLLNQSGGRISRRNIRLEPTPLRIEPGRHSELRIALQVPPEALPGTYAALLQADPIHGPRANLLVTVAP